MIEVTAKLTRGSVFIAGEVIECMITFRNPGAALNARSQSNTDVCETLAWASAQIHCQCTVSEEKVVLPSASPSVVAKDGFTFPNKNTSFSPCAGEGGHVVLATKPKILFCDVRLLPGESKTFKYCDALDSEVPPSYRGHSVKYSYKITVGMQRVGSTIRLLRVPIRILALPGFLECSATYSDSEDLGPSNPFLLNHRKDSPLDVALQVIQNLTARKSPSFYGITNTHGKVVRFCLYKLAYKLGDDIVGTFDFSDSTVRCVQFSVTLQSDEVISEGRRFKPHQSSSVVSYSKCHEVCLFSERTQMVLPIPLTVTPAFTTELASLHWRLHFEFVTTTTPIDFQPVQTESTESSNWQGPRSLDIETMIWDLPIAVYPTSPLQLLQGTLSKSDTRVCI